MLAFLAAVDSWFKMLGSGLKYRFFRRSDGQICLIKFELFRENSYWILRYKNQVALIVLGRIHIRVFWRLRFGFYWRIGSGSGQSRPVSKFADEHLGRYYPRDKERGCIIIMPYNNYSNKFYYVNKGSGAFSGLFGSGSGKNCGSAFRAFSQSWDSDRNFALRSESELRIQNTFL